MGKRQAKKPLPNAQGSVVPYEPSAEHLEWYNLWAIQHWSYRRIASHVNHALRSVYVAVQKVHEYYKQFHRETQEDFRRRQTAALEEIATNAIEAWKKSVGTHRTHTKKKGVSAGENGGSYSERAIKSEELNGNAAYLNEARAALADIRKIWGVDAPTKQEIEMTHHEEIQGLPQMGGAGSRAKALKEAAGALLEAAKEQEARETKQ